MNIIKKCIPDDLIALQELSCRTFNDAFAHLNTAANMKAYLETSYNCDKLRHELSDSNSSFYFLYSEGKLAGYLKLNEYQAQTDIHDPNSIELERIYVISELQGKALGRSLIDKAVETARALGKSYIWLGVWEKNKKAIAFYKKNGFYEIGKHPFFLGEEKQTDFIMRKNLE